jgi:hypothetical protein
MAGTKRLRAIARRSIWDTVEQVWVDVRLWLAVTLLVALLSAWRGLPWASYTVLTVIALAAVLGGVFLWQFGSNLRHPEQSPDWVMDPPRVMGEGPDSPVKFAIRSKIGSPWLESHACEATHPNGQTYRAESTDAGNGFSFYFWYPQDFGDAAGSVSGSYEVVWFLPRKNGSLREVLRDSQEVTL